MAGPGKVMRLLGRARLAVVGALAGIGVAATVLSGGGQAMLALGAINSLLAAAYAWALWNDRQAEFSLAAGLSLLVNASALGLLADTGAAGPWGALGLGLAAIMSGNHTCRSAEVLGVQVVREGGSEAAFYRAARHGYLRILLFVGLVMVVSLFVLLISLNAALGALPSWAFAALALAAVASLAVLAWTRHQGE